MQVLDPANWCLPAAHLVVDPEHVSDVDPNVDGIHFVGEGKVELVVVLDKEYFYLVLKSLKQNFWGIRRVSLYLG